MGLTGHKGTAEQAFFRFWVLAKQGSGLPGERLTTVKVELHGISVAEGLPHRLGRQRPSTAVVTGQTPTRRYTLATHPTGGPERYGHERSQRFR
jgi:hypothetical protein